MFFRQVFASDPWHLAQPGSIRNLTIQTKGSDQMNSSDQFYNCRAQCDADYEGEAKQKDQGAQKRSECRPSERSATLFLAATGTLYIRQIPSIQTQSLKHHSPTKCSLEGLDLTEKLQHNHSMDIEALKEEMAKIKRAGEDKKSVFWEAVKI